MIIINDNVKVSAIIIADKNSEDTALDSLINQTMEDIEIIYVSDYDLDISDKRVKIIKTDDFKISDINGKYSLVINSEDQYYLAALESLYDYSIENNLDIVLFSHTTFDNDFKINDIDSYNLQSLSIDLDKDVFSLDDVSDDLFSILPGVTNSFYKTSILQNNNVNIFDSYSLFFGTIFNANNLSIFPNQLYVKYEGNSQKTLYKRLYNIKEGEYSYLNDLSFSAVIETTNKICNGFIKSDKYDLYKNGLANFKIESIKYSYFDFEDEMRNNFSLLKDDLDSITDDQFHQRLNKYNLIFYNSVVNSNSYDEFIILSNDALSINSMKKLADNVIKLDFEEIESYDFPSDEMFGLLVNYKGIPYSFMIRFASDNDNLICFSPAAVNRTKIDSNGELVNPPFFQRWSWHSEFDESVIALADPSFFYDNDIRVAWFVGEKSRWYLEESSLILKKLLENRQIKNENVLFYGSSAGGYVSIGLGTLIKNSKILVNNAQFILMNYNENHVERLFKVLRKSFTNMSDEEIIDTINYRLNVLELFKRESYIPKIEYYINSESKSDIYNQCIPFLDGLSDLDFSDKDINIHFYKYIYDLPHNPLPEDKIIPIIKSVMNGEFKSDDYERLKNELNEEKSIKNELLSSSSWKLTSPLRKIKHLIKKIIK